ncbi:hypothetical protein ACIRPK_14445 [Kitasatospora sp. NPDC101801]|uniref:hypothetical protein n=1 Tax=Kitasatospora sp. NPDC101801 TaxID=3364103 RepID=UPI0037FBC827
MSVTRKRIIMLSAALAGALALALAATVTTAEQPGSPSTVVSATGLGLPDTGWS